MNQVLRIIQFQSTHPARGATFSHCSAHVERFISIHAPRERCDADIKNSADKTIQFQSTHPARGATISFVPFVMPVTFQSTHPARGATWCSPALSTCAAISIHAPRERCDHDVQIDLQLFVNFNPRTPREVRRKMVERNTTKNIFQSTHPARGATADGANQRLRYEFQSTHPARGATPFYRYTPGDPMISIHAPRERCDSVDGIYGPATRNFNPRTPREVRPCFPRSVR